MLYRIIIKPCLDPARSARIAEEVAAWAGRPVEKVRALLLKEEGIIPHAVCVKHKAEAVDAQNFFMRMMPVGAQIELVPEEDEDDLAAFLGTPPVPSEKPKTASAQSSAPTSVAPVKQSPPVVEPPAPSIEAVEPPAPAVEIEPVDDIPPVMAPPVYDTVSSPDQSINPRLKKMDDDDGDHRPLSERKTGAVASVKRDVPVIPPLVTPVASGKKSKPAKAEKPTPVKKEKSSDKKAFLGLFGKKEKAAPVRGKAAVASPVVFGSGNELSDGTDSDVSTKPIASSSGPKLFGTADKASISRKKASTAVSNNEDDLMAVPAPSDSSSTSRDDLSASVKNRPSHNDDDDDEDDDDAPGRIRSDAEIALMVREQGAVHYEVFVDKRNRYIITASLFASIIIGIWLAKAKVMETRPSDFFERLPKESTARFLTGFETPDQMKAKEEQAAKEKALADERAATLAKQKELEKPPEVKEAEPEKKAEEKPAEQASNESVAQRKERREATSEERKAKREEVSRKVSSSGLFAAIAAGSGSGSGGSLAAIAGTGSGSPLSAITGGAGGFADIGALGSGGGFAKQSSSGGTDLSTRRGEAVSGVAVEKGSVGRVEEKKLETAGAVSVTAAEPPVLRGETGGSEVRGMAAINRVVTQQQTRLKKVFEEALKREPTLKGKIVIRFVIMPDGTVTDASIVSSSTGNGGFDSRILGYVKRWLFPAADGSGPLEVTYPFVFSSAS